MTRFDTGAATIADLAVLAPHPDAGPGEHRYFVQIGPVFTIGAKVHGGALQVICAHAAATAINADGGDMVPLTVSTDFLGAPDVGEVEVTVVVRKRGRRVGLADVEIGQNGRVAVRSSVTLGAPDSGEPRFTGDVGDLGAMAVEPPADAIRVGDSPLAKVIHLVGAVDIAYDPRTIPFARGETGSPEMRCWGRPRTTHPDSLFALLCGDLSAPVVLNLGLTGWAPTLQLTTHLRQRPAPGWVRVRASTVSVGSTLFTEDHLIIDSTGTVVAQSRQLALVPEGVAP